VIPSEDPARGNDGRDVFVPWVLATQKTKRQRRVTTKKGQSVIETAAEIESAEGPSKMFNRYYHMFSEGELYELTRSAVQELRLAIGVESDVSAGDGVEIMQCGWERSNYYIEIRRWRRQDTF